MEASSIFLTVALICAAGAGFWGLGELANRAQRQKRRGRSQDGAALLRQLLLRGCRPINGLVKALLNWRPAAVFALEVVGVLREKGFKDATPLGVASTTFVAALLLLGCGTVLLGSVFSALAVVAGVLALAAFWVRSQEEKRRERIRLCVPDSIQAIKSCFQAGFSLEQTFAYLADHSLPELGCSYREALQALRLGCSAPEALDILRQRIDAPEFAFVVVALEVQHRTGGSLSAVLQDAETLARGHFELERSLRAQTAQARLSARVVSAMPFVLVGVFSLVTEGFLDPFFSSIPGVLMFSLAVVMQILGVIMVRRTLKVKGVSQ